MSSRLTALTRLVILDVAGSALWFPVWWYTTGLRQTVESARQRLHYRVQSYGLRIWVQNFFVPMYGQYDLTGRLVSIGMRSAVLIARSLALVFEAVVYGAGIVAWCAAPPLFAVLAISSFVQGAFFDQVQGVVSGE